MGSSVIRRWISRSEIFRSRRISVEGAAPDAHFYYSPHRRGSAANRKMSTTSGVNSPKPPLAPWLMLPPTVDGSRNVNYSFHCLAKKDQFTYKNKFGDCDELQLPLDIIKDIKFVGSSHGWLALYNRRNCGLLLSNPITNRHMTLPPLQFVDRVILSSSPEERECLAFKSDPNGGMGFCKPCSNEWDVFGMDHVYADFVYSSRHNLLFCVTWENTIFETWDLSSQSPRLDWAMQYNNEININHWTFKWEARATFKEQCSQLKYLVCGNHSDELFLVVRHVNFQMGPYGSLVDNTIFSMYDGCHYTRTPYKTIDFDVYKIDLERGNVMCIEDSLDGLALFVGINHSFAMQASEVAGVKPNSIYFTDENRVTEIIRIAPTNYGGHDNGIFDYQNKTFSPCCDFYPIEYHKIRKILPPPLWFTPSTIM